QALVAIAAYAEFRRSVSGRSDSEFACEPIDDREIEVDETPPGAIEDVSQFWQNEAEIWCARVELAHRCQVLALPVPAIVDLDVENRLPGAPPMAHGHGQPDRAFRTL